MSRTVYSEIFFHIVWRTKDSLPMITKEMRLSEKPGEPGSGGYAGG
ncbi:MAG TPA: hypothetical protein VM658_17835 [bacterium]|nr:hypothetical protein [bacterium]